MPTPGLPLPLRNALATLAISAHDDDDAAEALAWLAESKGAPTPAAAARLVAVHLIDAGGASLLSVHLPHAGATSAHAARALRAAAAVRAARGVGTLERAVSSAAALWTERLFFEVHEVLEAVWQPAAGAERQALQGVIQIAVAFHHLAHGNPRGARTLLREGRARLASVPPDALPRLDLGVLVESTDEWEQTLAGGAAPEGPPPTLVLRPAGGP